MLRTVKIFFAGLNGADGKYKSGKLTACFSVYADISTVMPDCFKPVAAYHFGVFRDMTARLQQMQKTPYLVNGLH